jgi:hypothetical protein
MEKTARKIREWFVPGFVFISWLTGAVYTVAQLAATHAVWQTGLS